MISVKNLKKEFVKYEREKGLKGMVKTLINAKKTIVHAVDDISFDVFDGEIVGYIGANGAGKSTTIKMLSGILTPTSGTVEINGIVPFENRIQNAYQIGVVFGQRTQLWWDLPLQESYTILKDIYNVSDKDFKERMEFFDAILKINEFITSPVRTLSLGQRMRADIVASLLHNPAVLFLDEPTIGLDVVAKAEMRKAIKELNRKYNTTVILTTHDLDDIEELCSRIIIIDAGKKIYEGSLDEIKESYGYMKKVTFELGAKAEFNETFGLSEEDLKVEMNDLKLEVRFNKKKITVSKIAKAVMSHNDVIDMTVEEEAIEDIVGNIYKRGEVVAS